MFTKQFLLDAGERAARTFAQSLLAFLGVATVGQQFQTLPWIPALSVAGTATVLSLLSSIASLGVGDKTASLLPAPDTGKHAK